MIEFCGDDYMRDNSPETYIATEPNPKKAGSEKYGGYNWRSQPVNQMVYVASALRHLLAHAEGEDLDPDCDLGKSHLDGAIGSLAILIDSISCGTSIDDRPVVKNLSALKALEQK